MQRELLHISRQLIPMTHPHVMAIVNITPDSFYVGSRAINEEYLERYISKALSAGANIIDIGGFSTRPEYKEVAVQEEWKRVSQACQYIRTHFPDITISLDTFRSEIAHRAIKDYNVQIINDISGGARDTNMFSTIAELGVPYVLTYNSNFQKDTSSVAIVHDMISFFEQRVNTLHQLGCKDIILDPGLGFNKTITENYTLLRELPLLKIFGLPILVGLSRKSMIYKPLNTTPENALNGTTALHMIALQNGANILRVHDVTEAKECIQLYNYLNNK